jgi:hypothetical protein
MIVDGSALFVGSDRSAALAAIAQAAARPKVPLALQRTSASPRTLDVALGASAATADATLLLAVVEDGLQSSVARGENQGRRLTHSAVTRRLVTLGKADHSGAYHAASPVTIDPSWKASAIRIVVIAQRHGQPGVVSAGTIALQ